MSRTYSASLLNIRHIYHQVLRIGLVIFLCSLSLPVLSAGMPDPANLNIKDIYNKAVTGDAEAQFLLFNLYRSGVGIERDVESAKRWLHSAGNSGHREAQYWLGYIYLSGQGVERSIPVALKWYQLAASQNFTPAEFILGHIYNGQRYRFLEREPETAIYWYTRAANHGDPQASLILGCKYYYGNDVEIDKDRSLKWFTQASMQGEPNAYQYYSSLDEAHLAELCERVPRS